MSIAGPQHETCAGATARDCKHGRAANGCEDCKVRLFSVCAALEATELDELDRIIDGDGEEITIQLTNGARLTGAELVARTLSERGLITLVHPFEGAVNLYRTERMANEKQRLMAAAENPVCPWPRCNYPADKCQIHHLEAWQRGGDTNMANLAACCPYHNGVNDDDPNAPPRRGRLARRRGRVVWQPPWADTVPEAVPDPSAET